MKRWEIRSQPGADDDLRHQLLLEGGPADVAALLKRFGALCGRPGPAEVEGFNLALVLHDLTAEKRAKLEAWLAGMAPAPVPTPAPAPAPAPIPVLAPPSATTPPPLQPLAPIFPANDPLASAPPVPAPDLGALGPPPTITPPPPAAESPLISLSPEPAPVPVPAAAPSLPPPPAVAAAGARSAPAVLAGRHLLDHAVIGMFAGAAADAGRGPGSRPTR